VRAAAEDARAAVTTRTTATRENITLDRIGGSRPVLELEKATSADRRAEHREKSPARLGERSRMTPDERPLSAMGSGPSR
jgi:hypothetical protein